MGFHEVQFPTGLSYNSSGGPGFNTAIIEMDGGVEERISRWEGARHRYDARYAVRTKEILAEVLTFFRARKGAAYGFRFKDWLDYTTNADGTSDPTDTDNEIGIGDGSTTQFQLVKKYTSGGITRTRNITKPVTGTTVIAIDGTPQGAGWTVDTTTGIVTFSSAPAGAEVITAGCKFDVPVRFTGEIDSLFAVTLQDFDIGAVPNIPLIEVVDEAPIQDEYLFGGSGDFQMSANTSVTLLTGRVLRVDPQSGSLKLIIPDPTSLPSGGPFFYIINKSGVNAFTVRLSDDTLIATMGTGEQGIFFIVDNAGTNEWVVMK
jgi:uncharacterized protein (TIGR02217 family)